MVQKASSKNRFWNCCGPSCTKHLRNEGISFFAFLHLSIRGNSQGPIKIKIYNLYNVLHQRHLLVIFISVCGQGCMCVNKMDVLVCHMTVIALSAVYSKVNS